MLQIQVKNTNREDYLAFAREKELTFEVLEFSMPPFLNDEKRVQEAENWYSKTGLVTSYHGAFIDINPGSGDEEYAELSKKKCIQSCEQAVRLGAKNIVFHSSCFSILRGIYLQNWARQCSEFFNALADKYDLNIYIENCQDLDPGPIRKLMELCNNPKIGVCFDTGHANCSPTPFRVWFSELRDYIGYIHLSDNMGRYDDHMEIGTGTVNWKALDILYRALPQKKRKNICMTLECGELDNIKASVEYLRSNSLMGLGEQREDLNSSVLDEFEEDDSMEEKNRILGKKNRRMFEALGLYMSDEIARQIVDTNGGTAFGGKAKELTVLLSDLRGFSAIAETMAPDDLLNMLSHYFDAMVDAVRRNEGTVLEFVGDSVFAIFGAPIEIKDHADKAVSAAIDMQAAMEEVNDWNKVHGYPVLRMGIGINTGELILGNIGCRRHIKYGVIGNAINMCSRIESFTVGDQIFISPTTREALTGQVEISSETEIFPKGFKAPITIYDVKALDGKTFSQKDIGILRKPGKPVKLRMRVVSDKIVSSETSTAEIVRLSETAAEILTKTRLKRFDDVRFDISGRLYAKVLEVLQEKSLLDPYTRCLVRFTSFPPEFDAWYKDAGQA